MKRDEVIATLRDNEPELRSAGVVRLFLFGSTARDEARTDSEHSLARNRGLGNRLRHDYDSIDIGRIWLVLQRSLPPLAAASRSALEVLEGHGPAR